MLTNASDLSPEPGCELIDELVPKRRGRTFVRGDGENDRLDIRYFRRIADGALVAKVRFGLACQGPPGHAHGGSIAAVLDDAMGVAAWVAGHMVVSAEIGVRFVKGVPLGTIAAVETRVERVKGTLVYMYAELRRADGQVCSSSTGTFVALGPERFAAFTGGAELE